MRRIAIAILALGLLTACDEPDDACTEEGKSKFYSTGKILTCENGKWVLRNGVGFTR
jgi:hypothetical protein